MQITFSLPHVFFPGSPPIENTHARRILVDCQSQLNQPYQQARSAPALYQVGTRCVVFTLPHAFVPDASIEENSHALKCLLECLVDFNRLFLAYNHPTNYVPPLYESGVFYKRTEVWDSIPALYQRGYGDCKSLSAAYVAQAIRGGRDCAPVYRWIPRPEKNGRIPRLEEGGPVDYHILVQEADGSFEDPSKRLGMGRDENGPT